MKSYKWPLAVLILVSLITKTNALEARGGMGGGFHGGVDRNISYHPEEEHPTEQYRPEDTQNWQHGNGYGYTHEGAHYNYYHNGQYFNYYHNGAYYNYYYKGNYYNYYNNGLYYLYFYNGIYYNTCDQVPPGYPHC